MNYLALILLVVFQSSCTHNPRNKVKDPMNKNTFGYDLDFLKKYKDVVVLKSNDRMQQVAVIGDYQGRVMTTTSNGSKGKSYGWINYDLIESGKFQKQINAFGGEDRFWLGPEGGQYSIFFPKDSSFTIPNWNTPAPIDIEPFELVDKSSDKTTFTKTFKVKNYKDFEFNVKINRSIELLDKESVEKNLGINLNTNINYVAYQTVNELKNIGAESWNKETGLLSIWILGMFNSSKQATIIIPYKNDLQVNTSYFGEIDDTRLYAEEKVVLLKADGNYRCKIGLGPINALPLLGSYDGESKVLTIVQYSLTGDTNYVNSLWKLQENPYKGDVVNAYNDGPMENGRQLGSFYELESSSSAKALKPNEMIEHTHRTIHFEADFKTLNTISKKVLGFDLNTINFEKKTK